MTWWAGTWLVLRRSLLENVRSRTFRVVTGLLLLIAAAAVVLPKVLADEATTYTLATVGTVPPPIRSALTAAADAGDFTVKFEHRRDRTSVHDAVREGDATAGLAGNTLYASTEADPTFPVLVAQAVVAAETTSRLVEAGLSPAEVTRVQSVEPPEQVAVGRVQDEQRAVVGFAVGIILYVALTFAGNAIAMNVALEKSTRISEVLMAVLRPSQIVVGTVAAVGIGTLAQLLVLAVPFAVSVQVTDVVGIPAGASADIALAVVWFILGFALYAFLFAAAAALVDKITEATSAVIPVSTVLVVGYVLAVTVVMGDPRSGWSALLSVFPLTAPMAMPIRWASGEVPVYQLLVAMLLTLVAAVLLVALSARIYQRALQITGRRVRWREVLLGVSRPRT